MDCPGGAPKIDGCGPPAGTGEGENAGAEEGYDPEDVEDG